MLSLPISERTGRPSWFAFEVNETQKLVRFNVHSTHAGGAKPVPIAPFPGSGQSQPRVESPAKGAKPWGTDATFTGTLEGCDKLLALSEQSSRY
jgi:hypothetical protein